MQCTNCKSEILATAKFCPECGTKVENEGRTCPNQECNRPGLPPEAVFCPDCGEKLIPSLTQNVNYTVGKHWKLFRTIQFSGYVKALSISSDGKFMAVCCNNGQSGKLKYNPITIYDIVNDKNKGNLIGHLEIAETVAYSPNGKLIASGSFDSTIRIWDANSLQCVWTLSGHNNVITGLGKYTYSNGDIYKGEWKQNQADGKGIMIYVNGETYEGEWKENKKHGKGILT